MIASAPQSIQIYILIGCRASSGAVELGNLMSRNRRNPNTAIIQNSIPPNSATCLNTILSRPPPPPPTPLVSGIHDGKVKKCIHFQAATCLVSSVEFRFCIFNKMSTNKIESNQRTLTYLRSQPAPHTSVYFDSNVVASRPLRSGNRRRLHFGQNLQHFKQVCFFFFSNSLMHVSLLGLVQ